MTEEETSDDTTATRYSSEEDHAKDHISDLPDEILLHLLSSIPFKFALATIALSTKWKGVWNRAIVKNGTLEEIVIAVGDLLLHFDEANPLRNPRKLQFHFRKGLILLATIGLKKKLHLDFSKGNQEFVRQFGWNLVVNSNPTHEPPPNSFFVKTLNLTSVTYLTNETVSSLLSNFQFLESLTIAGCKGLRSLRIDVVSGLLNLTVLDCPDLKCLQIEAYQLLSLRCRGPLCWFRLCGVLYLEDAMLDFREGPGYRYFEYQHFDPLLRAIRDVKVLTLPQWIFKEIVSPWLFSGHENLRFSRLKDLWWIDSSMEEYNIHDLVSFLKFCPSLKRLFISIDSASYFRPRARDDCSNHQVREPARMRNLKVVKVEGNAEEGDIIFLKEHLQEVFNVEPRIIAATNGSSSRCLIRIPKRKTKEIDKRGLSNSKKYKFSYKFVEEVEDNVGLCSKHAHMVL